MYSLEGTTTYINSTITNATVDNNITMAEISLNNIETNVINYVSNNSFTITISPPSGNGNLNFIATQ